MTPLKLTGTCEQTGGQDHVLSQADALTKNCRKGYCELDTKTLLVLEIIIYLSGIINSRVCDKMKKFEKFLMKC